MKPTLYLMLGYPGAGKTTTANVVAHLTGAIHLSSDHVRLAKYKKPTFSQNEHDELYDALNKETKRLLKKGKSVVYDANLNRKMHRQEKYDLAFELGVPVKLLWVQAHRHVAKERALSVEDRRLRPFGPMPEHMFERVADVMEEPSGNEPFVAVDGTRVSEEYMKQILHI